MADGIPARIDGAARPLATPTTSFAPHPRAPREPSTDWDSVGQGYYADVKTMTTADGPGIRAAVYVSGCRFACGGCFNESIWNPRIGQVWTPQVQARAVATALHPAYAGLSLLGGEPFQNTGVTLGLAKAYRKAAAEAGLERTIWSWTGYTLEWLLAHGTPDQRALLAELDVLVDGPFREDLKDTTLVFRGSRNQRILDVPASLTAGSAVPWDGLAHVSISGR